MSTAVAHRHTLYQSVGLFAVYLLTLSAKVCLNGNSGNKLYLGGESVYDGF